MRPNATHKPGTPHAEIGVRGLYLAFLDEWPPKAKHPRPSGWGCFVLWNLVVVMTVTVAMAMAVVVVVCVGGFVDHYRLGGQHHAGYR